MKKQHGYYWYIIAQNKETKKRIMVYKQGYLLDTDTNMRKFMKFMENEMVEMKVGGGRSLYELYKIELFNTEEAMEESYNELKKRGVFTEERPLTKEELNSYISGNSNIRIRRKG